MLSTSPDAIESLKAFGSDGEHRSIGDKRVIGARRAVKELREIDALDLQAAGYARSHSHSIHRSCAGLEYYTGPVFEAELTAPIKDERRPAHQARLGRQRRAL